MSAVPFAVRSSTELSPLPSACADLKLTESPGRTY